MVTAGNSSNAVLLLWPSMRVFQFGMGLLMQSHTGCSLTSQADFPDSRALLRQTWARISLFSSLWAWKLAMRPSPTDKGWLPLPSILWHRAAQSELETLSWTELPFLRESQHLCIVVAATVIFSPLIASKPFVQKNSVTWLLWSCFLFFLWRWKCTHHDSHIFQYLLHYKDKHVLRLPQSVLINEKEKKTICGQLLLGHVFIQRHLGSHQEDWKISGGLA